MAYPEDDEKLLRFGNPNLATEEEYYDQIHAPDIYGAPMPSRQPASEEQLAELPVKQGFEPEDIGEEVDASDEFGKQAVDAEPVKQRNPRLDKYQKFMEDYKKLQEQRQGGLLTAGLLQAGGQVGQALAGKYSGNFKPDESGIETIKQMANRPVTDFEDAQKVQKSGIGLQDDMESRDPSSHMSQVYRDYARKRLNMPELTDETSAFDIMNLLKGVGRPPQQKGGQIVRTFNPQTGQVEVKVFDPTSMSLQSLNETAGFALQPRVDPRTGETMIVNPATGQRQGNLTGPSPMAKPDEKGKSVQVTRENLTTKQQERLDKTREKFLDDTKDDRTAINAAQGIKATLASGKEIGGDILREIQNQLARGSGEKGAMTDRDVAPFGGRQSLLARVQRAVQMSANGTLPDEDRKFLTQVADVMEKRAQGYVANKSDFFIDTMHQDLNSAPNFKNQELDRESIRNLIGVSSAVMPVGNSSGANPNEIRRKTSDGRIAIFDKSKKFLRYADEVQEPEAEE